MEQLQQQLQPQAMLLLQPQLQQVVTQLLPQLQLVLPAPMQQLLQLLQHLLQGAVDQEATAKQQLALQLQLPMLLLQLLPCLLQQVAHFALQRWRVGSDIEYACRALPICVLVYATLLHLAAISLTTGVNCQFSEVAACCVCHSTLCIGKKLHHAQDFA